MKKIVLSTLALCIGSIAFAQSWYEIPVNTTQRLTALDFPSENVGYIVGDSGTMLKTIDGGANWDLVNYSGIQVPAGSPMFADVDFVDELNGFVIEAQFSPNVYRTADGGLTWTTEVDSVSNQCFKSCVYANDVNDFFVGGAGCFQSAQINHVTSSWNLSTVNYEAFDASQYVREMDFQGNVGLAAVNARVMLRSEDYGATWDTVSTGLSPTGVLTSVVMVDAQLCYAGYDENGGGFGILVSTDGGLTWEQDLNSATFFYPAYLSVASAANGDVYSGAVSSNSPGGLIFELSSGFWDYQMVAQPINDMTSYGTDVTFGVGDSGLVVVNTSLGDLNVYENETLELSIYPNPATKVVNIQVTELNACSYELIDLHGKVQIENVVLSAYTTQLNLSALDTGVYMLRPTGNTGGRSYRIVKQ